MKLLNIFISIAGVASFSLASNAAPSPKTASDAELQREAKGELQIERKEPSGDSLESAINEVVVPQIDGDKDESKLWRLGVSVQEYSFSGQMGSALGESFSFDEADSTLLVGLDLCRDLTRLRPNLKLGSCFNLAFANQSVNLETSKRVLIEDVSLTAIMPSLAASFSYKPVAKFPFYLSASLGMGAYLLTSSSDSDLVDGTEISAFYNLGLSSRVDIYQRVFVQANYGFRDLLVESDKQSIQVHNFSAQAGILF